jgi:hypothetical protein
LDNIIKINCRRLGNYNKSSVIIYSDVINIAAGAYTVELENRIFHMMWTSVEMIQSSTWRELNAIELALLSFKTFFYRENYKVVYRQSKLCQNSQFG